MKIALVVNSAWNLYNFRLKLLYALQEQGHELHLIAPEDGYSERLKQLGFRFHPLGMSPKGVNPVEDLRLLVELRGLYRTIRPDVCLQFTIKPNIYGSIVASWLNIQVINNVTGLGTAFIRPGLINKIVLRLYRFAFRKAYVFFQNTDDQNLFLELGLVKKDRTQLIPGSGVDLVRFMPKTTGSPSNVFLMVSRILIDKGVREYLAAAAIIKAEFPEAEFRLIGAFDEISALGVPRSEVEPYIQNGTVVYKEFTDTIDLEIHEADVVVLPSYREGTPRTLLEAAACGKPLITTEAPGCKDLVAEGLNGFKCEPKSAESLANAMRKFIQCNEQQKLLMGAASRKLVEEKYDEKIVIGIYSSQLSVISGS